MDSKITIVCGEKRFHPSCIRYNSSVVMRQPYTRSI